MTSVTYLEHYLDSLQHLPILLQRNFNLMRQLDDRAHTLMRKIDLEADHFLASIPSMDKDDHKLKVDAIQFQFDQAKEFCDDKVQLAIQTYELVDKHIRRLDSDLARFDAETKEKALNSRTGKNSGDVEPNATGSKKNRKKVRATVLGSGKKKRSGLSSEDDGPTSSARIGASAKAKHQKRTDSGVPALKDDDDSEDQSMGHPSDVLDMPVDPNEPTYCLCHQVSYGEMIGCDNPDCPIEWFHFTCVNLTVKPRGKWYCPKCIQDRKRK